MESELTSFTEKLKATSSNLNNMSATVENPTVPLVQSNGQPNYTSTEDDMEKGAAAKKKGRKKWSKFKQTRFENVGEMLAQRKELFRKRRNVSDVAFVTGLVGIILMIIHTELIVADNDYTNTSAAAIVLKVFITLSTIDLIGMVIWFHLIDLKLYMIDNGMQDWLLAISPQSAFQISLELIICAIHPIPGDIAFQWLSYDFQNESQVTVQVPLDVVLSIPMFLRLYLLCRVMLLHSKLFADARSQSLGALNKTKFTFYFIFKSLMYLHPVYVMVVLITSIFLIGSWALRVCEVDHAVLHESYWNSLWLVAITFLSVGYGDIVPHTYCGRAISVSVGMLGAGCTALVVAVLAQKLELSRAEKYVHNFVIDVELDKKLKNSAARILGYGWRIYRARKNGENEGIIRGYQRKLLKAIDNIRKTKQEQRKMVDSQVTVLEVYKNQSFISDAVENIITKQDDIEGAVETMKNQVGHIGRKLDELCRVMANRKERRDTKRSDAAGGQGHQADYLTGGDE
ncbi:small conductance calcium-activated potassium channel protein-like [Watersipora subatra]|uniref:small conductance calcium-activated potassium channel protein-like n=1 Tax=Watersipora subatra TaxID=2589382 RepID=UPI00355BF925